MPKGSAVRHSGRKGPGRVGLALLAALSAGGCGSFQQPAESLTEGGVDALRRSAARDEVAIVTHDAAQGVVTGVSAGALKLAAERRLEHTAHEFGQAARTPAVRRAVRDLGRDFASGTFQGIQDGAGVWITVLFVIAGIASTVLFIGAGAIRDALGPLSTWGRGRS